MAIRRPMVLSADDIERYRQKSLAHEMRAKIKDGPADAATKSVIRLGITGRSMRPLK